MAQWLWPATIYAHCRAGIKGNFSGYRNNHRLSPLKQWDIRAAPLENSWILLQALRENAIYLQNTCSSFIPDYFPVC